MWITRPSKRISATYTGVILMDGDRDVGEMADTDGEHIVAVMNAAVYFRDSLAKAVGVLSHVLGSEIPGEPKSKLLAELSATLSQE